MLAGTINIFAQAPEYLPEWKEGYLDIHTIATGRGDAALIVMPDGTSMMIDAGDNAKAKDTQHPDNTKKPGEWQAIYMKHFMAQLPDKDNLDYAMVTHLHNDHIGSMKDAIPGTHGYALSGITLVGEHIHFNKLVDRAYPDYDFPSEENVLNANKGFIENYIGFVNYSVERGMTAEKFVIGSKRQFTMVHNPKKYAKDFEIRNLTVRRQIPDLKVFGELLRVVHHHKLPLAPDGEFLHCHSVLRGVVDEVDVMLDKSLVRVEDIVSGRKTVVRICPVNQLVEMNMLAHEGDSGKRVAVRAGNRILYRADVVVMKMGDHRIVKVFLVRKL